MRTVTFFASTVEAVDDFCQADPLSGPVSMSDSRSKLFFYSDGHNGVEELPTRGRRALPDGRDVKIFMVYGRDSFREAVKSSSLAVCEVTVLRLKDKTGECQDALGDVCPVVDVALDEAGFAVSKHPNVVAAIYSDSDRDLKNACLVIADGLDSEKLARETADSIDAL